MDDFADAPATLLDAVADWGWQSGEFHELEDSTRTHARVGDAASARQDREAEDKPRAGDEAFFDGHLEADVQPTSVADGGNPRLKRDLQVVGDPHHRQA